MITPIEAFFCVMMGVILLVSILIGINYLDSKGMEP